MTDLDQILATFDAIGIEQGPLAVRLAFLRGAALGFRPSAATVASAERATAAELAAVVQGPLTAGTDAAPAVPDAAIPNPILQPCDQCGQVDRDGDTLLLQFPGGGLVHSACGLEKLKAQAPTPGALDALYEGRPETAPAPLQHVFHTCSDDRCGICLGGLSLCLVCHQAEAELEGTCPGSQPEPVDESEHDPEWSSGGNRRFMAALGDLGIGDTYEVVAAWLEANGKPRPSRMTAERRDKVLGALRHADIRHEYEEWVGAHGRAVADEIKRKRAALRAAKKAIRQDNQRAPIGAP